MSKSTISTYALMKLIPDAESARVYLEGHLWPNGPVCPDCKSERISERPARPGFYHCNACNFDFTVRTGTIFERSKVPLDKWVYAMYLLVTARKGISSMQLAKEIGVTQKTAWFILGRLREACSAPDSIDKLKGVKKLKAGRGPVGKTTVLGMRERNGRTKAKVIEERTIDAIHSEIHGSVEVGSQLYTDDHIVYSDLDGLFFQHESVNHAAGEYARGPVSTNSIESVWAVLKRGLHGVYHHASPKHLNRHVQEFSWRLNEGNVKRHSLERMASFIAAVVGKRLTYERLTA